MLIFTQAVTYLAIAIAMAIAIAIAIAIAMAMHVITIASSHVCTCIVASHVMFVLCTK